MRLDVSGLKVVVFVVDVLKIDVFVVDVLKVDVLKVWCFRGCKMGHPKKEHFLQLHIKTKGLFFCLLAKPDHHLLLQFGQQLSHQQSQRGRSEAFGEGFSR